MIHWRSLGTEDKIEAIRTVWFPGATSREIAAHFDGATRNAVIGIYGRYPDKLMHHPLPAHKRVEREEKQGRMVSLRPRSSLPPRPLRVVTNETALCGKPLLMLKARECRWPVNDAARDEIHLFCGLPADGPYCQHHKIRAVQPPRDR